MISMEKLTAKSKTPFFIVGLVVSAGLIGGFIFYSYTGSFDTQEGSITEAKHTIVDSDEKLAMEKSPSLNEGFEKEPKALISYSLQTSGGTEMISLGKGEKHMFNWPLNNKHPDLSAIDLIATGDGSQFVSFELDSITLSSNDGFENIPVYIEIPANSESGEHKLQLHAKRPDPSGFSLEVIKNMVIQIKP
jgi:hypothetical protein